MTEVFGKEMGRYTLLEKLGAGGMATVYNAFDTRMERNVALKVILPTRQSSKVFLARFLTEARALSQLNHTNIVKVLDYGEENGQPYLVMDFIVGGTLRDQMSGPVEWAEAAAILAPIARALEYVHKQRIVHRDVKPSNILIDEKGQPMLSDFGIIKLIEENEQQDMTGTGIGVGTPDYMSPEQGMGRTIDFHADIYALGIVFFELVTGRKPYQAETPMGVVIKHVREPMPKPRRFARSLPTAVQDVILKATNKKPANRFRSMGDFAEALELIAAGKNMDETRLRQIIEKKRFRPAPIIAIILTVLLAIFVTSYMFNFSVPAKPEPTATQARQVAVVIRTATKQPTAALTSVTGVPLTPTATATSILTEKKPTPNPSREAMPLLLNYQPLPKSIKLTNTNLYNLTQVALWGIGRSSSIAWSPDQRLIAVGTSAGLFIFDAVSLERRQYINTYGWVTCVLFSPDSKFLVIGLKPSDPQSAKTDITSQNSKYLTTGSNPSGQTSMKTEITLQIWDVGTGKMAIPGYAMVAPNNYNSATGSMNPEVASLAFVENGRQLAVGYSNGVLNLLDLNYDNASLTLRSALVQFQTVSSLSFSHDNRMLASGGQGEIYIWDINTGKYLTRILQPGLVTGVRYTPDDEYLISSGDDQVVRNYRMSDNQVRNVYTANAAIEAIEISPNGETIAYVDEKGVLTQLAMESFRPLYQVVVDTDRALGLAYSTDGARIAVTSWNEALQILDSADGQVISKLGQTQQPIERLEFSPDGKWLAVWRTNNTIDVWDVNQAMVHSRFDGHLPNGIAFSPDSKLMVYGNASSQGRGDQGQITIVDIETGQPVQTLVGYKIGWFVTFSPDQTMIVSGDLQTARIWDVSTYLPVRLHGGHSAGCGVFYSPDNQVLVTISDAGILFDTSQKITKLCAARDSGKVQILGITPDQHTSALKPQTGGIFAWNMLSQLDPQHYRFKTERSDFLGYSPGSEFAFVGSRDRNEFWVGNASDLTPSWRLKLFQEYDFKGATSLAANWIAIGANDGAIRLYGVRK